MTILKIEKKAGFTCDSGAKSVFFTHIENTCTQSVLVLSKKMFGGKALNATSEFPADSENYLVGCGSPTKPIGWCFKKEFHEKQCSHEAPRAFNQR